MVILDTDILIGILRNTKSALDFMHELEKRAESINTTSINAFELSEGSLLMRDKAKGEGSENLLNTLGCYNFDRSASWKAAEISAGLIKSGEILDFQDISIAAIAMLHGETLVTRNTKHFDRIKNLKTEKW